MRRRRRREFDVKINRDLTPQESDGKWDFEVTVTRRRDGKSRGLKGSGGETLIDAIVSRLKSEMRR